jgi:pimeloyl-ACP methyl ester carboxylesterase
MTARVFIHGLESSNQGTKSIFFREKFPDMIIPTFTGDLQERMKMLHGVLSGRSKLKLVGSSFGGLMATLFASQNQKKVEKMVLLAPALNLMEFATQKTHQINIPVWIYHGKADEVIPLIEVERIAREIFPDLYFHVVEDDHSLHKTFKNIAWNSLLA